MKIAILTASHLCRNPRVVKEATALGRRGHQVTVLNVSSRAEYEALDQTMLEGAPFHRITAVDLRPGSSGGFARRLLIRTARQCVGPGLESPWALGPAGPFLRRAARIPADLVLVHNELAFWAGCRLLERGRPVAADFEDWYSEDLLPAERRRRPLRLLRRCEGQLLQQASFVTTTSQSLAVALARAYGAAVVPTVIYNAFPLEQRVIPAQPHSGPLSLCWFSQTIGPGRGLEAFVAALGRLSTRPRLHLLGDPVPGYIDQLQSLLPPDRRKQLTAHGSIPPADLPSWLAAHRLGLALEPSQPANKNLTISNKFFAYLNAGLAVVATPTAGQREAMNLAPGAGILLRGWEEPELWQQLDEFLGCPQAVLAVQARARVAAETHFCWEKVEPILISRVESALASGPGSAEANSVSERSNRKRSH